ncbi:transposase [Streptomyces sp. NPDC051322]|uniref:transposase n=1 Tax=Streptomyces sp. NPDC051322 TaxID=3154645 RepID=UPI00344BF1E5
MRESVVEPSCSSTEGIGDDVRAGTVSLGSHGSRQPHDHRHRACSALRGPLPHKGPDDTSLTRPANRTNPNHAMTLHRHHLAADLRCWFQLLALDGELAKVTPKTLRYRILHVPAHLVRGQRKRRLKLPDTWPWATAIIRAFERILAPPHPTRPARTTSSSIERRLTRKLRDRGTRRHPARQPTRTPDRNRPRTGINATSRTQDQPDVAVKQRGQARREGSPQLTFSHPSLFS